MKTGICLLVLLMVVLSASKHQHKKTGKKSSLHKLAIWSQIKPKKLTFKDIKNYIKREDIPKWKQDLIDKYLHQYGWYKLIDMWRKHGFDKSTNLKALQSALAILATKRRLTSAFPSFASYFNATKFLHKLKKSRTFQTRNSLVQKQANLSGNGTLESVFDKKELIRNGSELASNSSSKVFPGDNTTTFRELQVGYRKPIPSIDTVNFANSSGILSFTTAKNVSDLPDTLQGEKNLRNNISLEFNEVEDGHDTQETYAIDEGHGSTEDVDDDDNEITKQHVLHNHSLAHNATFDPLAQNTTNSTKKDITNPSNTRKFMKSERKNTASNKTSQNQIEHQNNLTLPDATTQTQSNPTLKNTLDQSFTIRDKTTFDVKQNLKPAYLSDANSMISQSSNNVTPIESSPVATTRFQNFTDESSRDGEDIILTFDRLLGRKRSREVLNRAIEELVMQTGAKAKGVISQRGDMPPLLPASNSSSMAISNQSVSNSNNANLQSPKMNIFSDLNAVKIGYAISGASNDTELQNSQPEENTTSPRPGPNNNNKQNATPSPISPSNNGSKVGEKGSTPVGPVKGAGQVITGVSNPSLQVYEPLVSGQEVNPSQNESTALANSKVADDKLSPAGRTIGTSDLTRFVDLAKEEYKKGNEGTIYSQHIFPLLGDALGQPGQTHRTDGQFPMQMAVQQPHIEGDNMTIGRIDSSKMPYLPVINQKPAVTQDTPQMPSFNPSNAPVAPDSDAPSSQGLGNTPSSTGAMPLNKPQQSMPPLNKVMGSMPPSTQSSQGLGTSSTKPEEQSANPAGNSEGLPVQVVQTGPPSPPSDLGHDAASLNLPVMYINKTSKEWNFTNPMDLSKNAGQSKYDIPNPGNGSESTGFDDTFLNSTKITVPNINFNSDFGYPLPPRPEDRDNNANLSILTPNQTELLRPSNSTRRGSPGFITDLASIGYVGFNKSLDGFKDPAKGIDSLKALAEEVGIWNPKLSTDDDDDDEKENSKSKSSSKGGAESSATSGAEASSEAGSSSKGKTKGKGSKGGTSSSSSSSSGSESTTEVQVSVGTSSESSTGSETSTSSGTKIESANNVSVAINSTGNDNAAEGGGKKPDQEEKKPDSKSGSSSGSTSGSSSGSTSETDVQVSVGSDTNTNSSTQSNSESDNKSLLSGKDGRDGASLQATDKGVPINLNGVGSASSFPSGTNVSSRGFSSDSSIYDLPDIANWLHKAITEEKPKVLGNSEKNASVSSSKDLEPVHIEFQVLNDTTAGRGQKANQVYIPKQFMQSDGHRKQLIIGVIPVEPDCSQNKSCPTDQYCKDSLCYDCHPTRHYCELDNQCCSGLHCIYGRCDKEKKGSLGSICDKDGDCDTEACCVMEPTISYNTSICKPKLAEFHQCSSILFRKVWIGDKQPSCGPCLDGLKCVQKGSESVCRQYLVQEPHSKRAGVSSGPERETCYQCVELRNDIEIDKSLCFSLLASSFLCTSVFCLFTF